MRTAIWVTSLAVGLAYAIFAYATLDRRGDEVVLNEMIVSAAAAVENRDVGGVMDIVSSSYKDQDGMNYDRLRMITAQAVRSEQDYSVVVSVKSMRVDGENAIVDMHASVTTKPSSATLYDRDLTVHFAKESARHALLIPVQVWRVVKVENFGLDFTKDW